MMFQPVWKADILALMLAVAMLSSIAAGSENLDWKAHAKAIAMLSAALALCIYEVL